MNNPLLIIPLVSMFLFATQPCYAIFNNNALADAKNQVAKLNADNDRLTKHNDELQAENGNLKTRQGYLILSTGLATAAAVALFCVGLAVGIRIRRQYTQDESGLRASSI